MPTDVPLSVRSLGPSAGLISRASTAQFLGALQAVPEQQSVGVVQWASPSTPAGDCAAGRASAHRDRVAVATEESDTLASGGCTAPGLGNWTGEVVRRSDIDGRGRPGTAEGKPAGCNNDGAICLTQRVARSGLKFDDAGRGEMGDVLTKGGSGSFPPEPRSAGFVRKDGGVPYAGHKPMSPAASPAADPAMLAHSGFQRGNAGRPFAAVSNLPPSLPNVRPKPFEGPLPAKVAQARPFFGRKKTGEESSESPFGTPSPAFSSSAYWLWAQRCPVRVPWGSLN